MLRQSDCLSHTVWRHMLHKDLRKNKRIHFPYRPCGGPLSGSQWWRRSPCQWGLGWWRPCCAALARPCSGSCWRRQRRTSPARMRWTGCGGENGRKRSPRHEATGSNRNWKSRNQNNLFYHLHAFFPFIYSTSHPGCPESEETNCQVTIALFSREMLLWTVFKLAQMLIAPVVHTNV